MNESHNCLATRRQAKHIRICAAQILLLMLIMSFYCARALVVLVAVVMSGGFVVSKHFRVLLGNSFSFHVSACLCFRLPDVARKV